MLRLVILPRFVGEDGKRLCAAHVH
jgi:hypothetical protein